MALGSQIVFINFFVYFVTFNILLVNGLEPKLREKRQTDAGRSEFIDNIFQIPIQTLLAVNNLIQSSRGILRRPPGQTQTQQATSQRRSAASQVAGVREQQDGSAFRI